MPRTIADVEASLAAQATRLDRVEDLTQRYIDKLNEINLKHEREIAVLTEQLGAVKAENAVLRAAIDRIENRFWTLLSTTVFAVLSGLIAVLVAVIKK